MATLPGKGVPSSSADLPQPFVERLRAFITDAQAIVDLRRYFGIGLPAGLAPYTGSRFEIWRVGETGPRLPTWSPPLI
ncbi:hypothetical protein [Streptomyces sp. NPDC055709]